MKNFGIKNTIDRKLVVPVSTYRLGPPQLSSEFKLQKTILQPTFSDTCWNLAQNTYWDPQRKCAERYPYCLDSLSIQELNGVIRELIYSSQHLATVNHHDRDRLKQLGAAYQSASRVNLKEIGQRMLKHMDDVDYQKNMRRLEALDVHPHWRNLCAENDAEIRKFLWGTILVHIDYFLAKK